MDPNQFKKGKKPASDRKRGQSSDPKTPHNSYDEAPSKQQTSLLQALSQPLPKTRPSVSTAKSTKSCEERKKTMIMVNRNNKTAPLKPSRESSSDTSDSSSLSIRKDNWNKREMAKRKLLLLAKARKPDPSLKTATKQVSETSVTSIKENELKISTAAEGSPPSSDCDPLAGTKTPPKEKTPPKSPIRIESAPQSTSEQRTTMKKFAKQCQQTDVRKLEAAFKQLPQPNADECLVYQENSAKNRYMRNVLCLDSTRVVLRPLLNDYNDYIHANKLEYKGLKAACIITQAPLASTCADFWRMIWQEKTAAIFMLCKKDENGRNKCEEYFNHCGIDPALIQNNNKPSLYSTWHGQFNITPLSQTVKEDIVITELKVSFGPYKARSVTHYQCSTWPDFSVPNSSASNMVFNLLCKMDSVKGPDKTIVVHCSAGIGRSGTLVALWMLISDFMEGKAIEVTEAVRYLRGVRCQSVQTFEQFMFIHKFILQIGLAYDILKKEDVSSVFRL